jgi:hypothetical protein
MSLVKPTALDDVIYPESDDQPMAESFLLRSTLGWTTAALRTPEQADRWRPDSSSAPTRNWPLASGFVKDMRLPWERP